MSKFTLKGTGLETKEVNCRSHSVSCRAPWGRCGSDGGSMIGFPPGSALPQYLTLATPQSITNAIYCQAVQPVRLSSLQQWCLQSLIGIPCGCRVPSAPSPFGGTALDAICISGVYRRCQGADILASCVSQRIYFLGVSLPPFQSGRLGFD